MLPTGAALVILEMLMVLLNIVHGGKLCFAGRGLAITSQKPSSTKKSSGNGG